MKGRNHSVYLAADPGSSSGCLAAIIVNNETKEEEIRFCETSKHTQQERDVFIKELVQEFGSVTALIEKVNGFGMPAGSCFKFGGDYGFIQGIIISNRIPFVLVTPIKWQKFFLADTGPKPKGSTKTFWKNKLKGTAQNFYPHEKITLVRADALLMARYLKLTQ